MSDVKIKKERRRRRQMGIRRRIFGTPGRPRMTVTRSLKNTYVQIIDDVSERTLLGLSTSSGEMREKAEGNKTAAAKELGKAVAEKALEQGIKRIAFDRAGYRYQGRIKAVADAAREAGLQF